MLTTLLLFTTISFSFADDLDNKQDFCHMSISHELDSETYHIMYSVCVMNTDPDIANEKIADKFITPPKQFKESIYNCMTDAIYKPLKKGEYELDHFEAYNICNNK